jgi:hypothetical protein
MQYWFYIYWQNSNEFLGSIKKPSDIRYQFDWFRHYKESFIDDLIGKYEGRYFIDK